MPVYGRFHPTANPVVVTSFQSALDQQTALYFSRRRVRPGKGRPTEVGVGDGQGDGEGVSRGQWQASGAMRRGEGQVQETGGGGRGGGVEAARVEPTERRQVGSAPQPSLSHHLESPERCATYRVFTYLVCGCVCTGEGSAGRMCSGTPRLLGNR